jgi:hypothetical protein
MLPAQRARQRELFHAGKVQRTTDFSAQFMTPAAPQSERSKSSV